MNPDVITAYWTQKIEVHIIANRSSNEEHVERGRYNITLYPEYRKNICL